MNMPSRGGQRSSPHRNDLHPGHIIKSRSSTSAHVLMKRRRSRSRGQNRRQQQQREQPDKSSYSNRFNDSTNNRLCSENAGGSFMGTDMNCSSSSGTIIGTDQAGANNMGLMVYHRHQYGKINENGRCVRHTHIELACRDSASSPWRVLLQECPLCSLDDSSSTAGCAGLVQHRAGGGGESSNGKINSSSSQATTPSMRTSRTPTTEEESSVKSWTMSDASSSENEQGTTNNSDVKGGWSSTTTVGMQKQSFKPRPPPPPPPRKLPLDKSINRGSQESYQQQNPVDTSTNFDPIQSLKELGRKLVMESESAMDVEVPFDDTFMGMRFQAPTRSGSRHYHLPPPPPRSGYQFAANREQLGESISSLPTKELSHLRRQQLRLPPRRGTEGTPVKGVTEELNENIFGGASNIIARIESLTSEGVEQLGISSSSSQHALSRHQQQQGMGIETGEYTERHARAAQRRKDKVERKAAKLKQRESQQQRQQQSGAEDGSQTFTLPMNDTIVSKGTRGRSVGRGERPRSTGDILQAAAEIRARARRSTSRSRERVWEASIFCGEAPTPPEGANDDPGDEHLSLFLEKKRSILNPHGLEEQPSSLTMERRSQSGIRERRGLSQGKNWIDSSSAKEHPLGVGKPSSCSRNQDRVNISLTYMSIDQPSTAKELLNRRREMKQKIVERQSRHDQRRQGSVGVGGQVERQQTVAPAPSEDLSLGEEELEDWSEARGSKAARRSRNRTEEQGGERRSRGRSHSAVRDGISKIRSVSLNAFRKKVDKSGETSDGGKEIDYAEWSIDSGKRSTSSSSFKKFFPKPRSLSRGRGLVRSSHSLIGDSDGWAAKSEKDLIDTNRKPIQFSSNHDVDARSTSAKSAVSYSRLEMIQRSLARGRKKPYQGEGMVRSLSRGSFRDPKDDYEEEAPKSCTYSEKWDGRGRVTTNNRGEVTRSALMFAG